MHKFESDPYLRKLEHSQTVEESDISCKEKRYIFYQKKEELQKNLTNVFDSKVRLFPTTVVMIQAMYKLMKPGGILNKEGFQSSGYIKTDGEAAILFSRAFGDEESLLKIINASEGLHLKDIDVAVSNVQENSPMRAVTNYILDKTDLRRLKQWLRGRSNQLKGGTRHTLAGCRLRLIIMYNCCEKTSDPLLQPSFGEIKIKVG